jgi:hypothetical protein
LTDITGSVSNEFRYDQGFSLVVEYEVTKSISECSLWLGVRTAENVSAFDSADTDVAPVFLAGRDPGFYRSTVTIPPNWLNAGRYYLVVGIANLPYRISYDRIEFAAFTILDIGTPEKGRGGILQPYLPWTTVRDESVTSDTPS